ncbi:MAG: thiamine phosphate synthase [Erythrobacter sp. SCN 62-14]|nr:MAG: thiamine phosphate synthase [Erythrobacter sp. SCN 62-14]
MAALYSGWVMRKKPLPRLWLITDARNDRGLRRALAALPRGSGLIYRHYHLTDSERLARFRGLRRAARARGHLVILADSALTAREWGADGIYGSPRALVPRRAALLHLATVHNPREIALANRLGADAMLLSPVFATRSHPGGQWLGQVRFRLLAHLARAPVIALGGMTRQRARTLGWPRWAAIDGLS